MHNSTFLFFTTDGGNNGGQSSHKYRQNNVMTELHQTKVNINNLFMNIAQCALPTVLSLRVRSVLTKWEIQCLQSLIVSTREQDISTADTSKHVYSLKSEDYLKQLWTFSYHLLKEEYITKMCLKKKRNIKTTMAVNVTINNIFSSRNPTGISHYKALFQQLIMKYDQ